MRSDRNPYFFLKKSQDPRVQEWLAQAAEMTGEEIQALSIKPDLKKAMMFVLAFGQQKKSDTTANFIADIMAARSNNPPPDSSEFWEYRGDERFVRCLSNGWVNLPTGTLFMRDQTRMFAQHIWCDLSSEIWAASVRAGQGTHSDFNRLEQERLQARHV